MHRPKILVILGPTATSKSALAVELARALGGEVVSADSRQTYKKLNLGSGKITKKEMKSVPHHMLDVMDASKRYTADKFRKDGHVAISKILAKGRLPIVAGGTGFYIDALVRNTVYPDVKPNGELRKVLAKKSALALLRILTKLDPERAKQMDPNNKVRIIRAIEIAKALGKVPKAVPNPLYDAFMIGLDLPNEALRKNIKTRLEARLKKGMLTEVRNLHKNGLSWKRLEELGLEYQYAALYLQKKISKDQMVEGIINGSWSLVRRQRAWFKRDTSIVWYEPTEFRKILKESAKFLEK